jgi:Flp pilus assembly protein CpaB
MSNKHLAIIAGLVWAGVVILLAARSVSESPQVSESFRHQAERFTQNDPLVFFGGQQ